MDRAVHARRTAALDAERDCLEVYRVLAALEFPWDLQQALSFALFRTYAVPSIGTLLAETGELVVRTQKRYEDTALLLDAALEHGLHSPEGRTAFRRINGMHRAYDISPADMRYVLSTFVVSPIRWLDAYGKRPLTDHERTASAHHYREVGRLMGIPDLPRTWQEFVALQDAYEAEHHAFSEGGRAVADATLRHVASLPPFSLLPGRLVRPLVLALLDAPLLDAFGYPRPHRLVRAVVRGGLRLRGRLDALRPPRRAPLFFRASGNVRGYPGGYEVAALGTFPRGCPVPRGAPEPADVDRARARPDPHSQRMHSELPGSCQT